MEWSSKPGTSQQSSSQIYMRLIRWRALSGRLVDWEAQKSSRRMPPRDIQRKWIAEEIFERRSQGLDGRARLPAAVPAVDKLYSSTPRTSSCFVTTRETAKVLDVADLPVETIAQR